MTSEHILAQRKSVCRPISLPWKFFSLFKGSSQPIQGQQSTRHCSVCHALRGIHKVSKTQTWIKKYKPRFVRDHQHRQLYSNQLKCCGVQSWLKGVLESRVATRPHLPVNGREKHVCRYRPQTKHCQVAPDVHMSCWLGFHCPLVNASNTPWSCWRGKSIA